MLNCPNPAKHYSLRMQKIPDIIIPSIEDRVGMSSRPENVPKLSLSYSIDRDDHFYPRNVSGTLANCRYVEILSSRPTEVSGVKGEGKRWSTEGNRTRWRLHSACEIAGIPRWHVTRNSRGICRGPWVGTVGSRTVYRTLLDGSEDRGPTRPFFFATCSFTSLFGQIRRYRSGATTFTRRKVSVNVVSFSDNQSRTSQIYPLSSSPLCWITQDAFYEKCQSSRWKSVWFFFFATRRRRDPCNIFILL